MKAAIYWGIKSQQPLGTLTVVKYDMELPFFPRVGDRILISGHMCRVNKPTLWDADTDCAEVRLKKDKKSKSWREHMEWFLANEWEYLSTEGDARCIEDEFDT